MTRALPRCLLLMMLTSIMAITPNTSYLQIKSCPGVNTTMEIGFFPTGVVWNGWGTSLAWWANWAGGLLKSHQDELVDLIFDPVKGLGFTIARYNIPGGGMNKSSDPTFAFPLGFKASRNAPYNWSKDVNQRRIMMAAIDRGVNVLEAFSNSPPGWMTVSGNVGGSTKVYEDNLARENFQCFADYVTDVLKAYKTIYNITFDTLDPMNEPYEGKWLIGKRQEGCNLNESSIDVLLPIVASTLRSKGLSTKLAAADSTIYNSPKLFKRLGQESINALSVINVHSYETKKAHKDIFLLHRHRQAMMYMAHKLNKSVAVSEGGPWGMQGTEMEIALQMGRSIIIDINVLKATSWAYWQAVEGPGGRPFWGLIVADRSHSSPFQYVMRKQYFVMKQFSRAIVQGSLILSVQPSCFYGLVAAYNPSHCRLVVVVANYLLVEQTLPLLLNFRTVLGRKSLLSAFRTSGKENYSLVEQSFVKFPFRRNVTLPTLSITTFVFTHVSVNKPVA